jgi:transcriptional regulator with XRE-family HTH domain
MHYVDAFADRMNGLRQKKRLSKSTFARNLTAETNAISATAPEKHPDFTLTIDGLIATANVLGCSVDYLLGRTDNPKLCV